LVRLVVYARLETQYVSSLLLSRLKIVFTSSLLSEMEDEHTTILELDDGSEEKNAFFAVYDGHIGNAFSTLVDVYMPSDSSERRCYFQVCRTTCPQTTSNGRSLRFEEIRHRVEEGFLGY
jgi:serine/threonine protein phosphatase PrpC